MDTTTIDTALHRRIEVTMYRNGSGHISLSDPEFGAFVQASLSKDEIDKLREALTVDKYITPKFTEGDKVRVVGNTGILHYFNVGDIVTVDLVGDGAIIECRLDREGNNPLYQGVSARDLEMFTGPELVEGDVYLDKDLDLWAVRDGNLALHDGYSKETWDWVEEMFGPLKKVTGWHVVLPNGEKVKELLTDSPELFETKAAAEFRAKVRMEALISVGASDITCKVEPAIA